MRMKKLAILLLLLIFLPLPAEQLECSVCGRQIKAGEYYRIGESIVCSRECLDKIQPHCSVCGKAISGRFFQNEQKLYFCSEKCFDTTLPKCYGCGCPVSKGMVRSNNTVLCHSCFLLPLCSVCEKPIRSAMHQLKDRRRLCDNCFQRAIFSKNDAIREFNQVRNDLRGKFNLYVSGKLNFHLVDETELQKISQGEGDALGLCSHKVTTTYRNGKAVHFTHERNIYLLNGLTPERFRQVAAHELAHDWFNMNVEGELDRATTEGWAELVSWYYCGTMGYEDLQKEIENNGQPVYREGFFSLKKRLRLPQDPKKIRKFFWNMNPTRFEWSKKRR